MRVTILGVSATYPSASSPASGYLLQQGSDSLWIDAGSGTFSALQQQVTLAELSAVFLSHEHPDHCSDAIGLLYALRHGNFDVPPVPVFCPESVTVSLGRFVGDGVRKFADVASFTDLRAVDEVTVGDVQLTFAETNHPVPTLALRAESGGSTFAYTADTGPSDAVMDFCSGVDVLLAEATYQGTTEEKPWEHHLTATEAGWMAKRAGVGRLVLTHIWPELDPERSLWEAGSVFDGDVALAVPGSIIDI